MRVCDITREDEVTSAYTIIKHSPDVQIVADDQGLAISGPLDQDAVLTTIEAGKRAAQAIEQGAWGDLHAITPYNLRKKDPKRSAAAKKAGATKAAKRSATTPAAEPQAAPDPTAGGNATKAPAETASGAPSGKGDDEPF